jgi:hypothetical protein
MRRLGGIRSSRWIGLLWFDEEAEICVYVSNVACENVRSNVSLALIFCDGRLFYVVSATIRFEEIPYMFQMHISRGS